MSTHPNALLILQLTPDEGSRKTHRAILVELGISADDSVEIGEDFYHQRVMEENYYEDSQISAPEGSIVLWNCVTYGYGETISWEKLEAQKKRLEEWARGICERHKCSMQINVSANYW